MTNGQEELASLSYLITMAFARANAKVIAELGALFEARLNRMAQKHSDIVTKFLKDWGTRFTAFP